MTTGSAGKRAKQLKHIEYHGNRLAGTDNWNRAIHFLQQKLLHSVLCWLAVLMTGTTIWCTTSFFWLSKLLEHVCGNVDSLLHIVMPHFHSCIIVIPMKTTSMVFRSGWTCFDVFSSRLVVGVIAFLCTEWIWLKIKVKKHFIAKQKKTSFSTVKPTEEFFLCWFISCDEARWGMSQECFSHKIFASTSICLKICSEKSFWFLSCWEIRSLNYHDTHLTWDFYIYAIMIVSQQSFSTIF